MALDRIVRRTPRKAVAAVAVPLLAVVAAVAPIRIALVTAVIVIASVLAALGVIMFDLRRLLHHQGGMGRHQLDLLRKLVQEQQALEQHHQRQQRQLSQIRQHQDKAAAPRRMISEELIGVANTYAWDDRGRLGVINEIYLSTGFMPITLADPHQALTLNNLDTTVSPMPEGRPLVSVIMPVYNAENTVSYALHSVLAQTWRDLEVIVVDDASSDTTSTVVEKIASDDPRVKFLRQPDNRGMFAARNAGLAASRGDFVTSHDADDWSHGQMIQTQVEALIDDDGLIGTMAHGVRCEPDLTFVRYSWSDKYITPAFVSLMLRRSVFDDIGLWDKGVKCSADSEFLQRALMFYGKPAIRYLAKQTPLMFALMHDGSLTNDELTGMSSKKHALGARAKYADAYQRWHSSEQFRSDLPWIPGVRDRPFPAPRALRPPNRAERT